MGSLSIPLMRKFLDAEAGGVSFKDSCASIGVREGTVRMWLSRSKSDAIRDVGPGSSFFFSWREKAALFHQHSARARMEKIERLVSHVESSVTEGVLKPIWCGREPVWEQDPVLLAAYGGDNAESKAIAEGFGVPDYPYVHRKNDEGKLERVQACERVYPAASLTSHVLASTVSNYRKQEDHNVQHSGFVSVKTFSDKPTPIIEQTPALIAAKAEARKMLAAPGRVTRPQNPLQVPINRTLASDPPEKIGRYDALDNVDSRDRPRQRDPLVDPDPYARPEPSRENDPEPGRRPPENIGPGRVPPGGASMTAPGPYRIIKS